MYKIKMHKILIEFENTDEKWIDEIGADDWEIKLDEDINEINFRNYLTKPFIKFIVK